MWFISKFLFIIIVYWYYQLVNSLNHNPLLLLISFDGFRFDLLNSSLVPNIWNFAQKGVNFISGSKSQYITVTAPNHVSIVTGRIEESHGIVGNLFYDPINGSIYDLFNATKKDGIVNASLAEHFYSGEPIWLTNEAARGGRRSASMFWPAGDAHWPSPPHHPSIVRSWSGYKNLTHWMSDFDDVLQLFIRKDNPLNFVAWYIAEPDHVLHSNGFYNGELLKTLHELDLLFEYVIKCVESEPSLADRLNIILTADHGHAQIHGWDSIFCLSEHVDMKSMIYGDNMLYITDPDLRNRTYYLLKEAIATGGYNVDLFLKKDFPTRYGYANNERVGDIIIEPRVGSAVYPNCTSEELKKEYVNGNETFNQSTHGMDPDNWMMRALLVMKGPVFKEHFQIDTVANNVDLYPLMCYVLGVLEAPNNGSLQRISSALRISFSNDRFVNDGIAVIIAVALPIFVLFLFIITVRCGAGPKAVIRESGTNGYRPLKAESNSKMFSMHSEAKRSINSALIGESSEDEL